MLDTSTRRGLVDSAYNERRSCCEEAAKFFKVKALRDVSVEQFQKLADGLDPVARRRAMHVITENDRTEKAAEAMRRGDAKTLGELMNQSHESLNRDFEVSSDDLNAMVENARRHPACFGARMTGAGFGGCAVALIDAEAGRRFRPPNRRRLRKTNPAHSRRLRLHGHERGGSGVSCEESKIQPLAASQRISIGIHKRCTRFYKEAFAMQRRDFLKTTLLGAAAVAAGRQVWFEPNRKLAALAKKLPRWRGFNLLEKFHVAENKPFLETDFQWMSEWGFDFVRLPMDYRCWTDRKIPTSSTKKCSPRSIRPSSGAKNTASTSI